MDNRTYKTKVYLTCSSSQKNYTFAFDYINAKYVKAMFSDSKVLTWGTDYVVNGHTLTLTKEPTNGELLIIYRETPTDKTVEWYDSSILRAKDMNLFNIQLLHVNEENTDRLADSGIQEDKIDGRWDAREKSIKNLKAPTENSEAVNLGFLKKTQESYLNASQAKVNEATTQAQLATNQANNAKEYARQAKASADAASMSQVQASTKASEAQANASSASNSASNASTSADNASASETNAFNSERTAKGHEDKTREYMGTTLSYKLDAGQSATNANNSMIQSATYAEEAKKYRDEAKAIAGKDFVTNEAFESYKQSVPNSIQAKVDSHNESPDAHHQLFQDVNQKLDTKATKNELNTMKDNVNNQLANKADRADLSTKRDKTDGLFSVNIGVDANSEYSHARFYNTSKGYIKLESAPETASEMGSLVKCNNQDTMLYKLRLPNKNGVLAIEEDMRDIHGILHKYSNNTSFTNLSNQQWNQSGIFSCYFDTEGRFENQPTRFGQLINLAPSADKNSGECAQLWIAQNDGDVWTRSGNASNPVKDRNFRRLAWIDEIRYVVSESTAGAGFWREWSDGWLEQGGYVPSSGRDTQLNYNRPFRSEPSINVIARARDSTYLKGSQSNTQISYIGNTGCRISMYDANDLQGYYWQAWGWKA